MKFKSVWVLGSTSDVSIALCIELAMKGCKKFELLSRNSSDNDPLIKKLKRFSDIQVTCRDFDLLDPKIDYGNFLKNDFDLYIISSGYLGDNNFATKNFEEALKILKINFLGLVPLITYIASSERIKKPGAMWVFSSVAGDRGRPSNYIYGSAKSGLTIFCEGLLLRCANLPFKIRIIKAGFIDTKMSRGKVPVKLAIKPAKMAKILLKNPNKSGIEYIPWWWKFIMNLVKRLPSKIASKL